MKIMFLLPCLLGLAGCGVKERDIEYKYDGGHELMNLRPLQVTTEQRDRVTLRFSRKEFQHLLTYPMQLSIVGQGPFFLQTNGATMVVDGKQFQAAFEQEPFCETNQMGASHDSGFMKWPAPVFEALGKATAATVRMSFAGSRRTCLIDLDQKQTKLLQMFGRLANAHDDKMFHPATPGAQ
jgi:hypothetical protein